MRCSSVLLSSCRFCRVENSAGRLRQKLNRLLRHLGRFVRLTSMKKLLALSRIFGFFPITRTTLSTAARLIGVRMIIMCGNFRKMRKQKLFCGSTSRCLSLQSPRSCTIRTNRCNSEGTQTLQILPRGLTTPSSCFLYLQHLKCKKFLCHFGFFSLVHFFPYHVYVVRNGKDLHVDTTQTSP